jgi:hypothetical protein
MPVTIKIVRIRRQGRQERFIGQPPAGRSMTAGTATAGTIKSRAIAVTATAATGGTPRYSYQWQIRPHGSGSWSNAGKRGVTTRPATIKSIVHVLAVHHFNDVQLQNTNSAASTATANVLTITTHRAPRWHIPRELHYPTASAHEVSMHS